MFFISYSYCVNSEWVNTFNCVIDDKITNNINLKRNRLLGSLPFQVNQSPKEFELMFATHNLSRIACPFPFPLQGVSGPWTTHSKVQARVIFYGGRKRKIDKNIFAGRGLPVRVPAGGRLHPLIGLFP